MDQTQDPRRLRLAAGASAIAVVLWNVDLLAPALFPLRMLVTFVHEAGHGLTAILTGGDFLRFEISADGSGLAWTSGGWRWMVLPAGYVGASLSAAVTLVAAHRANQPRIAAAALAGVVAVVAVLFGWTSALALVAGLSTSAGLFALAKWATPAATVLVLDVVAFLMGWSSILDLLGILRLPTSSTGALTNDAAAFGEHVNVGGARLWAFVWLLVVLAILAGAARIALWHNADEDPLPA